MKKLLYVLLCLLVIAGIGGCVYFARGGNQEQAATEFISVEDSSESRDEADTDSDSLVAEPPRPTSVKGLHVPDNEDELKAEGLTMRKEATLDFTEGERAIRFTCDITNELYEEVMADENKSVGMLVFPQKFFDQVNTGKETYIDWINAFNEAGMTSYHYLIYTDNIGDTDTGKYMRFRLWDMTYSSVIHNITCIGVLSTQNADGSVTYQYAAMPDGETYQSNSRSIAYVAAENMNDHALGLADYDDAQLAKLRGYINEAVDLMNGLSEATDDGSTFAVAFENDTLQMSMGETLDLSVNVTPGLELANASLRIIFQSSNTDVVSVDEQGKVTALQRGTSVVKAYVAGESASITITVS